MNFDEAIAAPHGRFQVWGEREKNGKRTVMIYSLSDAGAKQLAFRHLPEAWHGAFVADLSERGLAIAEYDFYCDFVWIKSGDGLVVYNSNSRVLDATGDRAILYDGRIVPRVEIATVIAFARDDYVYRGVKASLRSGKEVPLVTEASSGAMGDPTYSRNELLMETGWAPKLAAVIATWAGVGFEDLI